jgi:hypothetical protein
MSRPGTSVVVSDEIPPVPAATDTSVGFMVGEAEHGPTDTVLIRSAESWRSRYGNRVVPTAVFDAVDSFFRDRGSRLYFKRLVDGAVGASADAGDFTATAQDLGAWGDGLRLVLSGGIRAAAPPARRRLRLGRAAGELTVDLWSGVTDGKTMVGQIVLIAVENEDGDPLGPGDLASIDWGDGSSEVSLGHGYTTAAEGIQIEVEDNDGNTGTSDAFDVVAAPPGELVISAVVYHSGQVVERSSQLQTVGDLVAWSAGSAYIRVTADDEDAELQPGLWAFTGGSDGTVPVVDPDVLLEACLEIDPALGPGQLSAPGKTALGQHEALLRGADFGNRVAFLDADPTADEAELTAHVKQLRTLEVDRCGGLFAPRAVIPGLAINTRRIVPWSGIQSGLTAHRDTFGNIAQPAAGRYGISRAAFALEREYDDDERERLMLAGVNTARVIQQSVRAYGFRSLVDPEGPRRAWLQLSGVRTAMAIKAEGDAEAENYVFAVLDGRLRKIAEFGAALSGICLRYWQNDALFGLTSEDAFRVDVGDAVNTPETIADGQLRGALLLKVAPFAEFVEVLIVKQAITESLV